MAQIIKQPNGKYCIFSSIVNNITQYDCSEDDIVEEWTSQYKKEMEAKVKEVISKLEKNEKPYFQFTLSFVEMLETIENVHGKKEVKEIQALFIAD